MTTKEIGKIKLTKGVLDVTDPCYDKDTWCRGRLNNVKKGTWVVKVTVTDNDNRIAELLICHEDYDENQLLFSNTGLDIGVDSGLAGFFEEKPDYDDDTWSKLCESQFHDKSYGLATPESEFGCVGVWSDSGYGDGGYDAYVTKNDEGEIVAAYIEYIWEED